MFSPDGFLLGSVTTPDVRVLEIADDYVLAVREDAVGVQHLARYRLEKNAIDGG